MRSGSVSRLNLRNRAKKKETQKKFEKETEGMVVTLVPVSRPLCQDSVIYTLSPGGENKIYGEGGERVVACFCSVGAGASGLF